jgi:hypothetical protein
LARLNADLERTELDAAQLTSSLETLSGLAQNISGRVAVLDLGKSRVVECLQRVNDLKDLGTCTSGVQEAIRAENFEEAARHIHRFLTLDSAVFKMGDNPEAKGLRVFKIALELCTISFLQMLVIPSKILTKCYGRQPPN